ncbi:MAG: cob(I)yrinic acid a,c-diamide adenosyltransferase [Terrimicrobiaceae bacterium]
MKIYTRTGDSGDTGLFSGQRVSKGHSLVEAYGTVDELNSALGLAGAMTKESEISDVVSRLQELLFEVGADLATLPGGREVRRLGAREISQLEEGIDRMTAGLPVKHAFILPGGTPAAAQLHVARTVCRRAERDVARSIGEGLPVNPLAMAFLNRLSDYLFVLARRENQLAGLPEREWVP